MTYIMAYHTGSNMGAVACQNKIHLMWEFFKILKQKPDYTNISIHRKEKTPDESLKIKTKHPPI